jgi:hypothetical protein
MLGGQSRALCSVIDLPNHLAGIAPMNSYDKRLLRHAIYRSTEARPAARSMPPPLLADEIRQVRVANKATPTSRLFKFPAYCFVNETQTISWSLRAKTQRSA